MTPSTTFQATPEFINKLDAILSKGLVIGLGEPEPGQFCVEAAIAYALGESHCDKPSCVAEPDRELMIKLNDSYPGTPQERAAALRDLAIAHLGTFGKDRTVWAKRVALDTIRVILPMALEAAASVHPDVVHQIAMRAAAEQCARAEDSDAAYAAAYAATAAAAYAAYAANPAPIAAAYAAAYAANAAAAYAAAAADANAAARKRVLDAFIGVVLEAYRNTEAP